MKKLLLPIFLSTFLMGCALMSMKKPVIHTFPIAVSVKELGNALKEHADNIAGMPDSIFHMGGLFKLTGFIEDKENNDIILVGTGADYQYSMTINDFNESVDNTLNSNQGPTCTIDPRPADMLKFNEMQQAMSANPKGQKKIMKAWQKDKGYQDVKTWGLKKNSSIGKNIVEADYEMKMLVGGMHKLKIDGYRSIPEIMENMTTIKKLKKKELDFGEMNNRFWFVSGEKLFIKSDNMMYFHKARIDLLNEAMQTDETGKLTGKGHEGPIAKQFIKGFNDNYDELAEYFPIFTKLQSIYNVIILQRYLKDNNKYKELKIDPMVFAGYPVVGNVVVPDSVPSLMAIKTFKFEEYNTTGGMLYTLNIPITGGVKVEPKTSEIFYSSKGTEQVKQLEVTVLKARPAPRQLFWSFVMPPLSFPAL